MYPALKEIEKLIHDNYNSIQEAPYEVRVLLNKISSIANKAIEEIDRLTYEDMLSDMSEDEYEAFS